jgi:exodeoxyribonuclease VII large subunit
VRAACARRKGIDGIVRVRSRARPSPDAVAPRESRADAPTSVSRLNETIRGFVSTWGSVWVEGEITAWNLRGGHVFGRLKDANGDAMLSFRLWSSTLQRLPDDLKVGDLVVACVKSDFFVKTGDFTFTVSAMRHTGLGDQLERLEKLRGQLRAEGLFDPARKKRLPFLPQLVGLITGERSDAEKDVHRNAELRWPGVRFRIHAAVQGERCVPETIAALTALDADPEVDVIIIARGGGDPQTLLGFSDERLVRAVAAASTPVVSAIGHENDHPCSTTSRTCGRRHRRMPPSASFPTSRSSARSSTSCARARAPV